MFNVRAYVEGLNDMELFTQLRGRGIAIGPVVDSTRPLYRRILIEIIQRDRGAGDTGSDEVTLDRGAGGEAPTQRARSRFSGSHVPEIVPAVREALQRPSCSWMGGGGSTGEGAIGAAAPAAAAGSSTQPAVRRQVRPRDRRHAYSARQQNIFVDASMQRELAERYELTSLMQEDAPPSNDGRRDDPDSQFSRVKMTVFAVVLFLVAFLVVLLLISGSQVLDPYEEIEAAAKRAIEEKREFRPTE